MTIQDLYKQLEFILSFDFEQTNEYFIDEQRDYFTSIHNTNYIIITSIVEDTIRVNLTIKDNSTCFYFIEIDSSLDSFIALVNNHLGCENFGNFKIHIRQLKLNYLLNK